MLNLLRIGRMLLLVMLTIITILSSAFYWLTLTTGGASWLINKASQLTPVSITTTTLQGSLLEGLAAERVEIKSKQPDEGLDYVLIQGFNFKWNPNRLFAGKISVTEISADDVGVFLAPPKSQEPSRKHLSLPPISLPIGITAKSINIHNLHVEQEQRTIVTLPLMNGSADFTGNRLKLNTTKLRYQNEAYTLSGSLIFEAQWQAKLHVPSHGLQLDGHCTASGSLLCEANAQWKALSHPWLRDIHLPEGQMHLTFENDTLNAAANTQLRLPELALKISTTTQTRFDTGTTVVESLELQPETGGLLKASGEVNWLQQLQINSRVTAQALNLQQWLPNPQTKATVSADGDFTIAWNRGVLDARTQIEILALDFGREPLSGQLVAEVKNNEISVRQIKLENSYNHLMASGSYHWKNKNIHLELLSTANDFKRIFEKYSGKASLKLSASGNLNAPNLKAEGTAEGVSVRDIQIGYLALALDVRDIPIHTLESTELENLSLVLENFNLPGFSVEALELNASGSASSHQIAARANKLFNHIDIPEITLRGRLAKQGNGSTKLTADNTNWQATLDTFKIKAPALPQLWVMDKGAQLSLAKSQSSIDDFCLRNKGAAVCLNSLRLDNLQSLALEGSLRGIYLDRDNTLFENYYERLPSSWQTQGELIGRVDLTSTLDAHFKPEYFSLNSEFKVAEAEIRHSENSETIHYPIEDTVFSVSGNEQNLLLTGRTTIDAEQSILLSGQVKNILSVQPDIAIRLQGNLHTLAYAQPFLTSVDQLDGKASIDLQYLKNEEEPNALVMGQVKISDVKFVVPATGSRISQWQLTLDASQSAIDLNGRGQIGEGILDINGAVRGLPSGRFPFEATVKLNGNNLQLVDLPDASFNASPDLVLEGENLSWHLGGKLVINNSFMRLRELPKSASGLSEDAVIYSDKPPEQKSPLQLTSSIEIIAGNNITFEGFGLTTNIKGHLNYARESSGHQQLHGSLTLPEGEFKSYGQNLKIENGQIIFSGSPSNPTLDVRAARTINNIQAGIWLNGTAKHPKSQLYSSPSMSEGDILSYMLTGKPMAEQANSETAYVESAAVAMGLSQALPALQKFGGNFGLNDVSIESDFASDGGSVAAGKRLNDKLYVKYQYGLVGAVGRFIVEYSLTDNLTIEAGSGEIDTIDITYTWDSPLPQNPTNATSTNTSSND